MCEIIDNGKSRIINKGTDVTIIASSEKSENAMKASRTLVVKGISTAIIELLTLDYLDKETILNYANKTKALVFIDKNIYELSREFLNDDIAEITYIEEPTIENIIKFTTKTVQNKIANHRGEASCYIHYVR